MKRVIFVIAFFCVLIFAGCERERNEKIEYERTIWVNPDVECCGVKDPLNNLEWLKEIYDMRFNQYEQIKSSAYEYIFLFRNDSNDYIVRKADMGNHSWFGLYECNGTFIDGGVFSEKQSANKYTQIKKQQTEEPARPCYLCSEFFEKNTLVDTISFYIIEPKK